MRFAIGTACVRPAVGGSGGLAERRSGIRQPEASQECVAPCGARTASARRTSQISGAVYRVRWICSAPLFSLPVFNCPDLIPNAFHCIAFRHSSESGVGPCCSLS